MEWAKRKFHEDAFQRFLQDRDFETKRGKGLQAGKKRRWARHQQKTAGSTQMWQVLSFFGKFHPDYLSTLPETDAQQPGSTTAEQKKKTRAAAEARFRPCACTQRTDIHAVVNCAIIASNAQ